MITPLGLARVFILKDISFELTGKHLEEKDIHTGLDCLEKAFTKTIEDFKKFGARWQVLRIRFFTAAQKTGFFRDNALKMPLFRQPMTLW